METGKVKERFMELRAQGWSFDKIAKELGKAKQTLIDWSRDLEDEIANLKALELEKLYGKYFLLKENRLQTFGELLEKIKKEALSRELSSLPTDKLLELLLKYENHINTELVEPVYKSTRQIETEKSQRALFESFG